MKRDGYVLIRTEGGELAEMPRYKSHKEVWALEIEHASRASLRISFVDKRFAPYPVTMDMFSRYVPVAGDFLVACTDGYMSFSPRKAFLEGYTKVASLLAIAAVAVSLLFAPAACAEEQVECMPGIVAARSMCGALVAQADAMREVLANAPARYPTMPIMDHCMRGLAANLPGYDGNTYFNTCSQILQGMATVH